MYVIDFIFSDGSRMKYVINAPNFYEAKNEANDIINNWTPSDGSKVKDFSIKEIRNDDNRKSKSPNNTGHSPKSKVRKHYLESDEE